MDAELAEALTEYAKNYAEEHVAEVNIAAALRHLAREALNLNGGEHSCTKEGYYAGIAEARKKFAAAFGGGNEGPEAPRGRRRSP